jgi:preprotein translocase subunit SecA
VNKHREVIYNERKKILSGADLKANIQSMIREQLHSLVEAYLGGESSEDWNLEGLVEDVSAIFPLPPSFISQELSSLSRREIEEKLVRYAEALYEEKERELGVENMRMIERLVLLRTIDRLWVEHLTNMENMRQGIGLRAVAQTDPLVAYKREGHALFQSLLANIQHDVTRTIFKVGIVKEEKPQSLAPERREMVAVGKVGRNDPCPCGSGKKYKKCCGK